MYRHSGEAVVAAWREVQRDILAVEPGSAEYRRLYLEAKRLRAEYEELISAARTNLRPGPPPFPADRP